MKEKAASCSRPTTKVDPSPEPTTPETQLQKEAPAMIKVGKPAPNFTAPAFHDGKFGEVSLSDYQGQWVYICFYPGDFTFV